MHKFPYNWQLQDGFPAKEIENHGLKVFTTFSCGGGSSFGYKLAGYDVIGANDIDGKIALRYLANHKPKHYFLCSISDLITKELPKELFDLDILDGSPPCSTFSEAGLKEKSWGVKRHFKEGQQKQVLSDLFFDFLHVANRLQPRVIVAENVRGILKGSSRAYVSRIINCLSSIGYNCQIFQLDASTMGVPQKRERVFFIASRKDLNFPKLKLNFDEPKITFGKIEEKDAIRRKLVESHAKILAKTPPSKEGVLKVIGKNGKIASTGFATVCQKNYVPLTITSEGESIHYDQKHYITDNELLSIGSWPKDYDFMNIKRKRYLVGMSVPPVMIAQIADQIYQQWFKTKSLAEHG